MCFAYLAGEALNWDSDECGSETVQQIWLQHDHQNSQFLNVILYKLVGYSLRASQKQQLCEYVGTKSCETSSSTLG